MEKFKFKINNVSYETNKGEEEILMKLFCRHEWKINKNTVRLYNGGFSKEAKYKCLKCGKEKWFDIFDKKPNKYVFKEYDKGRGRRLFKRPSTSVI